MASQQAKQSLLGLVILVVLVAIGSFVVSHTLLHSSPSKSTSGYESIACESHGDVQNSSGTTHTTDGWDIVVVCHDGTTEVSHGQGQYGPWTEWVVRA
jgi:hypothetical protein